MTAEYNSKRTSLVLFFSLLLGFPIVVHLNQFNPIEDRFSYVLELLRTTFRSSGIFLFVFYVYMVNLSFIWWFFLAYSSCVVIFLAAYWIQAPIFYTKSSDRLIGAFEDIGTYLLLSFLISIFFIFVRKFVGGEVK